MTRRDENALLRAAEAHVRYCEDAAKGMKDATAIIAFGALCLLLWLALHIAEATCLVC